MKKVSVTYYIKEPGDDYELKCANKAVEMNHAISDALNLIRNRLKYGAEVPEDIETLLTEIRSVLSEVQVDE